MTEYTVLFKLKDETVVFCTVIASSEEEAFNEVQFIPYFRNIEYDSWEVFKTYGE